MAFLYSKAVFDYIYSNGLPWHQISDFQKCRLVSLRSPSKGSPRVPSSYGETFEKASPSSRTPELDKTNQNSYSPISGYFLITINTYNIIPYSNFHSVSVHKNNTCISILSFTLMVVCLTENLILQNCNRRGCAKNWRKRPIIKWNYHPHSKEWPGFPQKIWHGDERSWEDVTQHPKKSALWWFWMVQQLTMPITSIRHGSLWQRFF